MQIEDEVFAIINETFEYNWEEYQDGTKGGFMKHLAAAFDAADMENVAKLAQAFPEIYEKYAKFHGDVLGATQVNYRDLQMGHEYKLCDTLYYGDAEDYKDTIIGNMSDAQKASLAKFTNASGEIEIPARTVVSVKDTKHGFTELEIDGLYFDCIFEDDFKFEPIN